MGLEKIAWRNLNKNSEENKNMVFVTPTKKGEVYPLSMSVKDFIGLYIGLFSPRKKSSEKKHIFISKNSSTKKYFAYSSNNPGIMYWHSEGCDEPCWPAGIGVQSEFELNCENERELKNHYGYMFEKYAELTTKF